MTPSLTKPVLIVGAGPTGLVVAIELARRAIPFRLIDRLKAPLTWDRAIFIKSRSLEIFFSLGVIDRFLDEGERVEGLDIYAGASEVAGFRFAGLDTPYPFILSISEDRTETILTDRLRELGAEVERGIEFTGLHQTDAGVTARLRANGSEERAIEASWVIGTDGHHSAVREAIHDPFEGRDYKQLWGVVDTHIVGWRHSREVFCPQLEPPVVIPFPLGKDRWRIYYRASSATVDTLRDVAQRLDLISPGAALEAADDPRFFHAHSRVARHYRAGRVLLAGDAAHASNPIEGHGMNVGIQDAHNLGWKLALVLAGGAGEALMDSYEAERRPVAQAIIQSGDEAEARTSVGGVEARLDLFDFLSTAEGRSLAALAESELGFGYDESPIVAEIGTPPASSERGTAIGFRVGDVTDLVGPQGEVRLHDLTATTEHTLFLLLGDATRAEMEKALLALRDATASLRRWLRLHVVSRAPIAAGQHAEGLLSDPSGALHDRLCAGGQALCLVRPDGHLGFRGAPQALDALAAHLVESTWRSTTSVAVPA